MTILNVYPELQHSLTIKSNPKTTMNYCRSLTILKDNKIKIANWEVIVTTITQGSPAYIYFASFTCVVK